MRTSYRQTVLLALVLTLFCPAHSQTRDPWLWPFDSTSIWNMPIGSEATYQDIDLVPTRGVGIDVKHFLVLDTLDPIRPIVGFNSFAPRNGRCSGTEDMNGLTVHLPDDFLVPDVYSGSPYGVKPNASFVFLQPDRQTTWNGPAIARCAPEGPLYMRSFQRWPNNRKGDDLFGDGVTNTGGQGASAMSGLGGTLRLGELIGDAPIRHAIKINPWGAHLYYGPDRPGYRWPATSADQYANDPNHKNQYVGANPELVMGALLAVSPDVTAEQLGLVTEPARKILFTLQYYGAYITEDAGWDVFDFIIEEGVEQEFEAAYGFSMRGDLWESEMLKIAEVLQVISNNGPTSIGGGGTPLQPLACELGEVGSGSTCATEPPVIQVTDVLIDQCPESTFSVGDQYGMSATVLPIDASNPVIVWVSGDPDIAVVDSLGFVRTMAVGCTEIIVSTIDGEFADTCLIHVAPPDPPSTALLSHWPFDNDHFDASGNDHPAVINGASFTSNRGQGTHALLLDGTDDWVDLDHPSLEAPFATRTIMLWLNMDDRGPSSTIYEEGGAYNGLGVKVEDSRLFVRAKVGADIVDLDIPYTYRHYQHIAVTFDQGVVRLFHNGLLTAMDSLPVQSMPDHGNPAALGATHGRDVWQGQSGQFMKGKIDDVRIYSSALSGAEVAELMGGASAEVFGSEPQRLTKTSAVPYPNPSSGVFWFSITEGGESPVQLMLYDLSGAVIMREKRPIAKGIHKIDLSHSEPGIYILQVNGDRFPIVKR